MRSQINKVAKIIGGRQELGTPVGKIHLVTKEKLYEFRDGNEWREGMGKLLSYSFYYPKHQLILVLVDKAQSYLSSAIQHCRAFYISVKTTDEILADTVDSNKKAKAMFISKTEQLEIIPKSSKNQLELECAEKLAQTDNGEREVITLAGRIDVLSEKRLYELKMAENWKHALGQLLVYGFYYPSHQLVLALVGNEAEKYLSIATEHCDRFNVHVIKV